MKYHSITPHAAWHSQKLNPAPSAPETEVLTTTPHRLVVVIFGSYMLLLLLISSVCHSWHCNNIPFTLLIDTFNVAALKPKFELWLSKLIQGLRMMAPTLYIRRAHTSMVSLMSVKIFKF